MATTSISIFILFLLYKVLHAYPVDIRYRHNVVVMLVDAGPSLNHIGTIIRFCCAVPCGIAILSQTDIIHCISSDFVRMDVNIWGQSFDLSDQGRHHPFGHKRVYMALCEVADTPFYVERGAYWGMLICQESQAISDGRRSDQPPPVD